MAKFLNTGATSYQLEELIKHAHERLILISPFLKLDDRIKELLEEKNRLKIDVRISDEVQISLERGPAEKPARRDTPATVGKMSTHRLAKKMGLKTQELLEGLERLGAIEVAAGHRQLTAHGARIGGEFRSSARFGDYFVWPEELELAEVAETAR